MRKKTIFYLFLTILISCKSDIENSAIIGKWGTPDFNHDFTELTFYKDSIIIHELGRKINAEYEIENGELIVKHNSKIINKISFNLSSKRDTLFIGDSSKVYLVRISNNFVHLKKIVNLELEIPEQKNSLVRINTPRLDVFIGYNDDQIQGKTLFGKDIKELKNLFFDTNDSYTEKEFENFKFNFIVDKKVEDYFIDSLQNEIRKFSNHKIYRTYKNDTINYSQIEWDGDIIWYGVEK